MMTCCTLGARPDIEVITKAMLPVDQGGEGLTVRAVADRFGVKRYLVERHWGCLKAQGINPDRTKPLVFKPPQAKSPEPESERRPVAQTSPQTEPQTTTDNAQTRTDTLSTDQALHARTRSLDHNEEPEGTYRQRVMFIANLITLDRYNGRKTNIALGEKWGINPHSVQAYARAAGLLVSKDRGPLELQREVTLAKLETIRKAAMGEATATCPECSTKVTMPIGKWPDLKSAIAATQHMDRVSGVLTTQPFVAQINIFQNQAFAQVWQVASDALKDFPGAAEAVERRLLEFEERRRMANMLPAREIVDEQAA